jgi:hypothetical protein
VGLCAHFKSMSLKPLGLYEFVFSFLIIVVELLFWYHPHNEMILEGSAPVAVL